MIRKICAAALLISISTSATGASFYNLAFETTGTGRVLTRNIDKSGFDTVALSNITINFSFDVDTVFRPALPGYAFSNTTLSFRFGPNDFALQENTIWNQNTGLRGTTAIACIADGPDSPSFLVGYYIADPSCGLAALSVYDSTGYSTLYSGVITGVKVSLVNGTVGEPVFYANGIPEPTTWAMVLLGFGMIAGAVRHRKYNLSRLLPI